MKKLLVSLALLLPLTAAAQNAQGGARASVGVEWKVMKGLHVNFEQEIRMDGVFQSLGRLQTTLGVDYKLSNHFKVGGGYIFIAPYDYESLGFKNPRHRVYLDGLGHYDWNGFRFSLKERLQYTYRSGSFNPYQNTRNALALKTRLGIEYKDWTYFEPGFFFEIRTALNEPWGSVSGNIKTRDDGQTYYDYTPEGYSHVYNNRYRLNFRTDIKLSQQHVIRPYALVDFCTPYVIDTNSEGTRLFEAAYKSYTLVTVGLAYTFKF